MTIEISYESKIKLDIPYEYIINKMVVASLDFEDCPYEAEVSVTIVDDDEIRRINNEYRGIDKSTDVLSFPFNEFDIPGNFDNIEENIILGGIGCPWLANTSPRRGAKQAETFCNKGQDKTHNEVSRRSWKHDDWANVYRMARLAGEHP